MLLDQPAQIAGANTRSLGSPEYGTLMAIRGVYEDTSPGSQTISLAVHRQPVFSS